MSVIALNEGYTGEIRDREENFHGKQLLFIGWEDHLMFCAPHCIPVEAGDAVRRARRRSAFRRCIRRIPTGERSMFGEIEWFRSGERVHARFRQELGENGLGTRR